MRTRGGKDTLAHSGPPGGHLPAPDAAQVQPAPVSFEVAAAALRVQAWVERARTGDREAFSRLVEHFQPLAYHIAYERTEDSELAADCCQEAMLSAWQSIGSFTGDADGFRRWLTRIVVHKSIDQQRAKRRRLRLVAVVDTPTDRDPLPELPDPGPTPEGELEQAELRALLQRAIDELPGPYRITFLLHLEDFTYAELAEILEVELGTVRSRMSRARGNLRGALAGPLGLDDGDDTAAGRVDASATPTAPTPPARPSGSADQPDTRTEQP